MLFLKKKYKFLINEKIRIYIKKNIRKFYSYKYIGNNVTCNCCNRSFKHFLKYGNSKIKRLNAACPYCYSLERTRILWYYLNKTNILKQKNSILHFAPEPILEKHLKKNKNIKYLSADINANLAMEVVDITRIKYNKESFDIIICSHVLSVIENDMVALKEMYRVLKKGGLLILIEHIYSHLDLTLEDSTVKTDTERIKVYGQSYLKRLYGKDFIERPIKIGFKVKPYKLDDIISKDEINNFGMQNVSPFYLCTK